jgi:hypothetical protein
MRVPRRRSGVILSGQVIRDPVDVRRRIDRLVARVDRRDDYGQLLARGQVVHRLEDVEDIEAWRAEIRRNARADKIKVRTGFNDGIVWALRVRADRPEWQAEVTALPRSALANGSAGRRAAPRTVSCPPGRRRGDLRLRPLQCAQSWELRRGGGRGRPVRGRMPNEEPPMLTALVMMHVPSSRWPRDSRWSHRGVKRGRADAALHPKHSRVSSISVFSLLVGRACCDCSLRRRPRVPVLISTPWRVAPARESGALGRRRNGGECRCCRSRLGP